MPRLSVADLGLWVIDPDRQARAADLQRILDSYGDEQERVFVPDVPLAATIPVVREEMWFHGLGPMAYANMLRRFKRVLEPMVRPRVEGWRGRRFDEVREDSCELAREIRPTLDERDRQDGVVARHLQLALMFVAFYGYEMIDLAAAGESKAPVYGDISDGTHRLFVAQALGSIDTLPAWVNWRTRKLSPQEIAAREEEQRARAEAVDVVVIDLNASGW